MRLGHSTNGISCEFEMQDHFKKWLQKKELMFIDEFHVSEVSRRADFLILKAGNGLINVEAKCNHHEEMMRQLKDHARYCDYSFAFIPDYCITSKWTKRKLIEYGFGLIIYNLDKKIITEALEAHHNKPKEKDLKSSVIRRMKLEIKKRKPVNEIQQDIKF